MGNDLRNHRRLSAMIRTAIDLGRMSTCRRLRVGCLIVTPTMTEILAIGYNGPPSGEPNDSCRGETPCGCVHAEANALVKLRSDRSDLVLLTTESPCEHCAGLIVNSRRISSVWYSADYRDGWGVSLLDRAEISTRIVEPIPRETLIGERHNGPSRSDLDSMSPTEWAVRTMSFPAFRKPTSLEKLARIGISLTDVTGVNLLSPAPKGVDWDSDRASAVARSIDLRDFDRVYMAGNRVAEAFGVTGKIVDLYGTVVKTIGRTRFTVIPHPSGLNRFWNVRDQIDRLKAKIREFQQHIYGEGCDA